MATPMQQKEIARLLGVSPAAADPARVANLPASWSLRWIQPWPRP